MTEDVKYLQSRDTVDHLVELKPRRVLGRSSGEPLTGRMSLGEPLLEPFVKSENSPWSGDLYLDELRDRYSFFELQLVMTLYPDGSKPFRRAAVSVSLDSGASVGEAICWSLYPDRSESPVKITSAVALTGKLGFVSPSAKQTSEYQRQDAYVRGLGERQRDFEWRYQKTVSEELVGIQRMYALIRASQGASFTANIVASASILLPRIGRRDYRADLPDEVARVNS